MAQRTLKRVLAGGVVLVALTLTTPAPAHAAGLGAESLWSWLSGFLAGPAPTTVSARHAHKPSPRTGPLEKIGAGIDPNGCTGTQTTGASGSICGASSSLQPTVDPNG